MAERKATTKKSAPKAASKGASDAQVLKAWNEAAGKADEFVLEHGTNVRGEAQVTLRNKVNGSVVAQANGENGLQELLDHAGEPVVHPGVPAQGEPWGPVAANEAVLDESNHTVLEEGDGEDSGNPGNGRVVDRTGGVGNGATSEPEVGPSLETSENTTDGKTVGEDGE